MGLFKKKEEEVQESKFMFYEPEKEKIGKKSILYIVLMSLVGLCLVFSLSTYLRWNRDIEGRKEVLITVNDEKVSYYNDRNDLVEIKKLVDFYNTEVEISLRDNEALVAYCGVKKSLQSDCIVINPSNGAENMMRHPGTIISIILILELLLLYLLLASLPKVNKILVYVFGGVITFYGVVLLGFEVSQLLSYYATVNKTESFTTGTIVKEIKDSNISNHFLPVYEYKIEDKEYKQYSLYSTKKSIGDEETLYYRGRKYENIVVKHNPINLISIVISVLIVGIGLLYIKVLPSKINNVKKKESDEEVKA